MGGIRETLVATALVSFALLPCEGLAAELKPFDASSCEDDGGWVICPQLKFAGKALILSHEQFEAMKTASPLSEKQLDQALGAYKNK